MSMGTNRAEENKALVHRFVDQFWSSGNSSIVDELMAQDAHISVNHQPVTDLKAFKGIMASIRQAFPDWYSAQEELLADGDSVAERWTGHGTQRGDFQGIAATGRKVAVPGTVFYRIAGDKIVEFRGQFDRMSLLEQLGNAAVPTTAQAL